MAEPHPFRVDIEREQDGRWLAAVPELPGVMAYGETQEAAVRQAKAIALQILADMIESSEELPEPLKHLFAALTQWRTTKSRPVYAALLRIGCTLKKRVGSNWAPTRRLAQLYLLFP